MAIALVWFPFTWMEFSEATVYLSHYWFISVMGALMIFLPLASRGTVARGAIWLVRFQVGIVYCFAGLAKLNTDWLAVVAVHVSTFVLVTPLMWTSVQLLLPLRQFMISGDGR